MTTRVDSGPADEQGQGSADQGGRAGRPYPGEDAAGALGAEAARLADAFAAWAGGGGPTEGTTASAGPAADSGPANSGPADAGPVVDEPGADPGTAPVDVVCGCGRSAGIDAICRVCPVCRAATNLHTVRPEVLERVADVLAMIAGSLQAIAADWTRDQQTDGGAADNRAAGGSDPAAGATSSSAAPAGVPIPVHGDDDPTTEERT